MAVSKLAIGAFFSSSVHSSSDGRPKFENKCMVPSFPVIFLYSSRYDEGMHGSGYGLLGEAIEQHAASFGTAAVKSEGEFVEVVVKMLMLDAALQGSHEPSLEQ